MRKRRPWFIIVTTREGIFDTRSERRGNPTPSSLTWAVLAGRGGNDVMVIHSTAAHHMTVRRRQAVRTCTRMVELLLLLAGRCKVTVAATREGTTPKTDRTGRQLTAIGHTCRWCCSTAVAAAAWGGLHFRCSPRRCPASCRQRCLAERELQT